MVQIPSGMAYLTNRIDEYYDGCINLKTCMGMDMFNNN